MGKIKDLQERREKPKVDAVLDILRKQSPLSLRQVSIINHTTPFIHLFIQLPFVFNGVAILNWFELKLNRRSSATLLVLNAFSEPKGRASRGQLSS